MKEKKKKEESTSSGTPKKKTQGKERLSSMIESMQKRGSPVNAHRVATKYFDSFRKERNIPDDAEPISPPKDSPTPVDESKDSTVITAVESGAGKKTSAKKTAIKAGNRTQAGQNELHDTLSPSESKVYRAMHDVCRQKGTDSHRFGLKMLRELTGLSDKTVRNSVHSLEDKMCIVVVEPSVGIYGRKIRVLDPEAVFEERKRVGIEIDPTTRMIVGGAAVSGGARNTAVPTAIYNKVDTAKDTAVRHAVDTPVTTAVNKKETKSYPTEKNVEAVYKKYTDNPWGAKDREFHKSTGGIDIGVIESAIILTSLKGEGGIKSLSDIKDVLEELGNEVPEGYLAELRKVWLKVKSGK